MAKKLLVMLYLFNAIFIVYLIFVILSTEVFVKALYKYVNISFIITGILIAVWFIAYIIISIRNIFYAKKLLVNNEKDDLKKSTELIKLKSVPFWILNFIFLFLITIAAVAGSRGGAIFLAPIPIFISYIILLGTSIFSIAYIRLLYKKNHWIYPHDNSNNFAVMFYFGFF